MQITETTWLEEACSGLHAEYAELGHSLREINEFASRATAIVECGDLVPLAERMNAASGEARELLLRLRKFSALSENGSALDDLWKQSFPGSTRLQRFERTDRVVRAASIRDALTDPF